MTRRLSPVIVALVLLGLVSPWAMGAALRTPGYSGVTRPVETRPVLPPAPASISGNGAWVDLFVDAAGAAHVVWNEEGGTELPDTTVYCRVPRGGRACDVTQRLIPPGADRYSAGISGPTVTGFNDQVIVMSHRYPQPVEYPGGSSGSNAVYMWTSDDGGQSFTTGGLVATGRGPNSAVVGSVRGGAVAFGTPDEPLVATASGVVTGGVSVTTMRPGSFIAQGAEIARGDYVDARLTVVDGRPLVVYAGLDNTVSWRHWTGQGDVNDGATWTAPVTVPGRSPEVATAGGAALMVVIPPPGGDQRLVVHRLGVDQPPVVVTPPTHSASRPGITGRSDGSYTVTWQAAPPGMPETAVWSRTFGANNRVAADTQAVAAGEVHFRRMAAADDGGGFLVGIGAASREVVIGALGTRAPSGQPGLGSRRGADAGPGGAGGPLPADTVVDCQRIRVGAIEALLQEGCFLNAATGAAKVTSGPFRLNGLEIIPDAGVQVLVNARQRTLDTTGNVRVVLRAPGVPEITLFRGRINIRLESARVGQSLFSIAPSVFRPDILGFRSPVDVDVRITDRGVEVPLRLSLPSVFGGVTGAATLRANNTRGLIIDSLEFRADNIPLGVATMRRMHVQYMATGGTTVGNCLRPPTSGAPAEPNEWAGVFELALPPPQIGAALCGSVRFGDGRFRAATFRIDLPPPGIQLFPGVAITSVQGGLQLSPRTRLDAGVRVGVISAGGGASVINVDGRVALTFGSPFEVEVAGAVSTAGVTLGSGEVLVRTDGYARMRLSAGPTIGPFAIRAGMEGFVDAPRGRFSISGRGEICYEGTCLPAGEAIASSRGLAICIPVSPVPLVPPLPRGGAIGWGDGPSGLSLWFVSCDMSAYRVSDAQATDLRLNQAAPERTVEVPRGAGELALRVQGDGAIPSVDLVAPDGAVTEPQFARGVEEGSLLFLHVDRPAAGVWTVRARPDSVPLGPVASSHPIVLATIDRVRVGGRGRARTLSYRARIGAGQQITLVERSRVGERVIGTARTGVRSLRFGPGPGPAGRREIVAQVAEDGLVRASRVVARYAAPGPVPVGQASRLTLRRAGARVVATWRPGSGLVAQRVTITGVRSGTQVRQLPRAARRTQVVGVRRGDRVSVRIVGLAADGRMGRTTAATLRVR